MFWQLANGFLHLIFGTALYILLFRQHFRISIHKVYAIAVVFVIIGSISPSILYHMNPNTNDWVGIYAIVVSSSLMALCIYVTHFSLYRILLVFFIIGNYMDSISLFKESIGPLILDMLPGFDYYAIAVISRCIGGVLSFPLMVYFGISLLRPILNRPITKQYFKFLWITPACFFVMYRICINPGELSEFFVFHDIPFLLSWVWIMGTSILTYSVLKMLEYTMDQEELERRLELASLNTSMQMKQYENIVHQIEDTKAIRHDLRHHMLALKTYCDTNDFPGVRKYLDSLVDVLELDVQIAFCENMMLNGILKHYYQIAKEAGIQYDVQVSIPSEIAIEDEDLCVLVGNAVENAIEACKRQQSGNRFIHMKAQVYGHAFTMLIKNSYEGKIKQNKEGNYISSKRNEEGIGLNSIRQICEKYNGVCKSIHEHHVFTLSVLLNQTEKE